MAIPNLEEVRSEMAWRILERRKMKDDMYFVENYVWIENKQDTATTNKIPFLMWPEQRAAWESIENNQKNVVIKARQLGMTWLVLARLIKRSLDIKGYSSIFLSQSMNYATEAIDRGEFILSHMPSWYMQELKGGRNSNLMVDDIYLYECTKKIITIWHPIPRIKGEVRQKSTIKVVPATAGAGRSLTADEVVFDEWAFHKFADKVWQAAYATFNRVGSGKFIGISTNERGSLFEEVVQEHEARQFNVVFLPWYTDPSRTEEWYAQVKEDLPDSWMQEYPSTIEEALSAGAKTALPEFSKDVHVCKTFTPPAHWPRWASVDNGFNDPFAWYKYTVNEDGTVFVYYEMSRDKGDKNQKFYDEQGADFMESCWVENPDYHEAFDTVEPEYLREPISYIVAGLDAWSTHHRDQSGKNLTDYYSGGVIENGVVVREGVKYGFTKAVTDRKLRLSTVHQYLKPFDTVIVDGITGEKRTIKTAKVQIMDCCPHLIKTLPKLVKDDHDDEKVKDDSTIDNPYDSFGYGLISHHKKKSKEEAKTEDRVRDHRRQLISKSNRSRKRGILN